MKSFISCPKTKRFETFFTDENIRLAESLGETVWNETRCQLTPDEVASRIGDSEVYVTAWGSPRLDGRIILAAPKLKLLCHLCGTVTPYVSEEMWESGIRVISGSEYFAMSVAEGTVAYILTALRDIPKYSGRLKKEGIWKTDADLSDGLFKKKVGIVGYGAIGRRVAGLLVHFGADVHVCSRSAIPETELERQSLTQTKLEELFETCDIVSLHLPLTEKTKGMVGAELLSRLKDGALFVNTSRGAVVKQGELVQSLESGRFRAVLDVFEKEPPEKNDPLFGLPNVIMMPHMAGPTTDIHKIITRELLLESAGYADKNIPLKNEITKERAEGMSTR